MRDQVVPLGWIWWLFFLSRHILSTITWNHQWWALLVRQRAGGANWQAEKRCLLMVKKSQQKDDWAPCKLRLTYLTMLGLKRASVVLQRVFNLGTIDVVQLPSDSFLSNYILKTVWVEGCLCWWCVITSLISICFKSLKWLKPMFLSLTVMLLICHVFLNSPMWFLMWQQQSEVLSLLTVRIIKLITSKQASQSPSYPALTTPPPPRCTERKRNNRMTHRWRELPAWWPCGKTEWI